MIQPVRLRLSRAMGFKLQEHSRASNGLAAVKIDRSTKWGNPFRVGSKSPYGSKVKDARHSASIYAGFAPFNEKLVEAAKAELAGLNLACWCELCDLHATMGQSFHSPVGRCPYCAPCHCDTLGKIANGLICEGL